MTFADQTDSAFLQDMLTSVNTYRAKHGAPAVVLDQQLTDYAKSRAALMASRGRLDHTGLDPQYGENLYRSSSSAPVVGAATGATQGWYSENVHYDYTSGTSKDGGTIGHFTQLVWKGSTKIGAGRVYGQPEGSTWYQTYIVVNFSPPGNMQGQYVANVSPPQA
jgi:glioma pathogenesis-related protein 2